MKIILATQSPRRIAIMELAKIDFEVMGSNKEEKKIKDGINIDEQSIDVAYQKALDVYNNTQGDRAIIGADTIVVKDNKVYGKPIDRKDAIKMLKQLQNDVHTIYTSLAILIEDKGQYKEYKDLIKTNVTVHSMSEQEIIEYVDSEEPYDKAGAYAIQSCFAKYIDEIEGNYMSVIGLPIDRIYKVLKENEIL